MIGLLRHVYIDDIFVTVEMKGLVRGGEKRGL